MHGTNESVCVDAMIYACNVQRVEWIPSKLKIHFVGCTWSWTVSNFNYKRGLMQSWKYLENTLCVWIRIDSSIFHWKTNWFWLWAFRTVSWIKKNFICLHFWLILKGFIFQLNFQHFLEFFSILLKTSYIKFNLNYIALKKI